MARRGVPTMSEVFTSRRPGVVGGLRRVPFSGLPPAARRTWVEAVRAAVESRLRALDDALADDTVTPGAHARLAADDRATLDRLDRDGERALGSSGRTGYVTDGREAVSVSFDDRLVGFDPSSGEVVPLRDLADADVDYWDGTRWHTTDDRMVPPATAMDDATLRVVQALLAAAGGHGAGPNTNVDDVDPDDLRRAGRELGHGPSDVGTPRRPPKPSA